MLVGGGGEEVGGLWLPTGPLLIRMSISRDSESLEYAFF